MTNYYDRTQKGAFVESRGENRNFELTPVQGGWLWVKPPAHANFREGQTIFHLSIHPEDVKDAWNIAAEEMMNDSGLFHAARVATPDTVDAFSKETDEHGKINAHAGKMITIYTDAKFGDAPGFAERYQRLLQRIEDRLDANGIRRGLVVKGDYQVKESSFISYRRDVPPEQKAKEDHARKLNDAQSNSGDVEKWRFSTTDPYAFFSIKKDAPDEPLKNVANWTWHEGETKNGVTIMRVMVEDDATALKTIRSLKKLGIRAMERYSETLHSLTVRIWGEGMKKVQGEQERQKRPQPQPQQTAFEKVASPKWPKKPPPPGQV